MSVHLRLESLSAVREVVSLVVNSCGGMPPKSPDHSHSTSIEERWDHYCSQAGVACTIDQLRHSHATELINGGVSVPTFRTRLGHKHLQTTLRYAEQADETAGAEVRAWSRQRSFLLVT